MQYEQTDIIAFIAGLLVSVAWYPQIMKILRTKHAGDISFLTLWMTFFGNLVWIVYGFAEQDLPIVAVNVLMGLFIVWVLVLKARYRK